MNLAVTSEGQGGQRKQNREMGIAYPEPRGPRVLPVGELVLWYGMFAPCGLLREPRALPVGLHI
jgi:hypothetical protein